MTRATLQSHATLTGRLLLLLVGTPLLVPAILVTLAMSVPRFSDTVLVATLVGLVLAYVAFVVFGIRRWAVIPARFEVDETGLRAAYHPGTPRQRVQEIPWGQVEEYVMTDYPNGARSLAVRARGGAGRIVVSQGPRAEDRPAFGAFHEAFLAAVSEHPAGGDAPAPRAGVSFFDRPAAKVLAALLILPLLAAVGGLAFSGEADAVDVVRLVALVAMALPFVIRVFRGK